MPSNGSGILRPPVPARSKTIPTPNVLRKQNPKSPGPRIARRSAPGRIQPTAPIQPAFIYPSSPSSFFLPLTVEIFGQELPTASPPGPQVSGPSAAGPLPADHLAITHLDSLVADSTLTAAHLVLLDAVMKIAQFFVVPGEAHILLPTIASTPAVELHELVNVIVNGMRAFLATPGRNSSSRANGSIASSTSNASRSDTVKATCAARDNGTCIVTETNTGACCHIIPFSARGEKAKHFWEFVAMFKGTVETQRLKTIALGPEPSSTDNIRNVVWLSPGVHQFFNNGELAIVPVVPSGIVYDPATTTEYTAHIELPYGSQRAQLGVWSSVNGKTVITPIEPGHTITLRTSDPATLPLPHPLLFQLHTAFTRLRKMCAAAGIPILTAHENSEDEYWEQVDYADELDDQDLLPPRFAENDLWPGSSLSAGLPLKERFLQLLCGAEASETEQYYNAIDLWASNDAESSYLEMGDVSKEPLVPDRKRAFESHHRGEDSSSERSWPATEMVGGKRRWGCAGRRFSLMNVGDSGSE